jgi:hypothetical protein
MRPVPAISHISSSRIAVPFRPSSRRRCRHRARERIHFFDVGFGVVAVWFAFVRGGDRGEDLSSEQHVADGCFGGRRSVGLRYEGV